MHSERYRVSDKLSFSKFPVCHLQFDSQFRAKQRWLKAEFFGQLSIDDAWQEGLQLSLMPQAVAPFSVPRQGEVPTEVRLI